MRHGSTNRRQRNRGSGNGGSGRGRNRGQPRMQVYDSNGPDVRIRGTAHQVAEKYAALAKDAASSGDRVLAESYLQHAEHYQRIISSWNDNAQSDGSRRFQSHEQEAGEYQDQDETGEAAPENSRNQPREKDDLSLPASILGEPSKAKSEDKTQERTPETSTT